MKKARANNIAPASAESPKSGEVSLFLPPGVTELISGHEASKHVRQSTSVQATPPGLVCPPITGNTKHRAMIRLAQNSFSFFISSSVQSEILARRIIALADIAYNLRQINELELLGRKLKSIKGFEYIGAYYQGLAVENQGRGDLGQAQVLFEQAAAFAPGQFKARAILSLGAVEGYRGNTQKEAQYYARALSIDEADYYTRIETGRAVALLHALDGDHRRSIERLEAIYPLARRFAHANARLYLDVLNSLTVEYTDSGNLYAARQAFAPVIRSPLADSIQEYRETARELQEAAHKTVVVTVLARSSERRPQQKVIIRFQYVESSARRGFIKPIIRRAPVVRSTVERVATVAPIHAPPFCK
ncbi:MAG: hypothetical protein WBV94_20450 [Blastocatellia bacterium]